MGEAFGAEVEQAGQAVHGETKADRDAGISVFAGLNKPLTVTRYHSLVVAPDTLPECFDITAWTEREGGRDEIMGIMHKTLPLHGVQFHPESIMSEQGHQLLDNFLKI